MHPMCVDEALSGTGLFVRGAFHPREDDRTPFPAGTIVLIGNVGPTMWQAFRTRLPEGERAGLADPLDSWVRGAIEDAAARLGAEAVFPFDGPPFHPFQRWAVRAEPVYPSPLGIMIHPEYGLWHAYRGALALREVLPLPSREKAPSPCETCRDEPCLAACPVGAFRAEGYDVPACIARLRSPSGRACLARGCKARRACPIGRAWRYEPPQAEFHMHGFLAAVGHPRSDAAPPAVTPGATAGAIASCGDHPSG
jgi:ferredoxin